MNIKIGDIVIPVASAKFTCGECGGEFDFEWSDEEARAEAIRNGFNPDSDDMAIICDNCYQKVMSERNGPSTQRD